MDPTEAASALDEDDSSLNSGLIPPELFGRILARSRSMDIDHNADIADVDIAPTPPADLPERPQVGFDPDKKLYQPRAGWKARLTNWIDFPPGAAGGFPFELALYWRRRTREGKLLQQAWAGLNMSRNNAGTSLHIAHEHRGMIPPELIGRVVARSRGSMNADEDVPSIILYPEMTV